MKLCAVRVRTIAVWPLLITLILLPALPGRAADDTNWEVGAQAGPSFNNHDGSFGQYEALLNYKLPWRWELDPISLGMRVISTFGSLHGGGDVGAIGSLGLGFVFGDGYDFNLRVGSAATYMTEDEYGNEDLGTHFQFTSHIGVTYRFWNELSARCRVQHMSNA
ncbi:MAG: acyloxyacyl hydrolase, partial [Desulfobacterales bacterium]|nr:acyloxyacyl hydrolase [Desulfobacterales bacterium]